MANEEHVAILKQGVEVWNKWRREKPTIQPDLSRTYHFGARLSGASLSGENLSGVNLSGVNLSGAKLSRVNLNKADLRWANLSEATLVSAYFNEADLRRASLYRADLRWANLSEANLSEANLGEARLYKANLSEANLNATNLTRTGYSETTFGNVDLSQVKGLEITGHWGPSYIDIRTIYRSGGNIPEAFLRGAGVPDNFITFMKSLTGSAFDFYSCFISHSSKDKEFVERLHADLQSSGVRCWYAPEDLKIGEPFLLSIDQGIRLHDKLLLVLSENSVGSGWVQHEVLSAMAKEQGKAPWVLFPIRLDNAVMETDVSWANMIRQSRHIGDFTQWKNHDSYKKAFDRLLRDLKGKS